jgi:hypothetical protein
VPFRCKFKSGEVGLAASALSKRETYPPETEEDRECEREWKREQAKYQFKQLKRLAFALGVKKVITAPESAQPPLDGAYAWECSFGRAKAREWGLSERQAKLVSRLVQWDSEAVILLSPWAEEPNVTFAHEIGHDISIRLARLDWKERAADTPSKTLKKQSGLGWDYLLESRNEIHAELMGSTLPGSLSIGAKCVSAKL